MMAEKFVNLPSDECNWTLQVISQLLTRIWIGAIKQQAVNWGNVE